MTLSRAIVEVSGPDALGFLQGQLSADLLGAEGCRWSLLLEPNGRIVALILVRVEQGAASLSVEAAHGQAVVERLERFKLRTDASIVLREAAFERRRLTGASPEGAWLHRWRGVDLVDVEVPAGNEAPGDLQLRVELGLPANGVDLDGGLFASALGQEVLAECCSSSKGCYTGQELVARTTSRGTMAPELLVYLQGPAGLPLAGSALRDEAGDDVGHVSSVVPDGSGWRGLGRLKRAAVGARTTCGGHEVPATPFP